MLGVLRRVAPSIVAFVAGAGLEVSGFEDIRWAIGIWSFAALYGTLALVTLEPVRSRLPRPPFLISIQRVASRKSVVPRPAEKGFLDFIVEFQENGKRLNKSVGKIGRETAAMGANIRRQTPRLKAATNNPARARRIASKAARDMDRFSTFLERELPNLKNSSESMTGSWASWLRWQLDNASLSDAEKKEVRVATTTFRNASRSGRSGIKGLRDSVQGLRDIAVSQDINRATEHRLLPALDEVIGTLRSLEQSCLGILRLVQESPGTRSTGRKKAHGSTARCWYRTAD